MTQVLEAERVARESLQQSLAKLGAISSDNLVRTDQLGSALDFRAGVEVFERTLALYRSLQSASLDNIPQNLLAQLTESANQALSTFQQIQEFDPAGQSNPASVRDGLIQQVASQYDSHFPRLSPVIAYSVRKGTDFERLERDARGALEEITRLRGEIERRSATLVSEAQATLAQVQRAAAEVA